MKEESHKNAPERASPRKRPPKTPEEQEQKMINLAMRLAEKKLIDGTASSQVITHFLQLATQKAELEREKLRADNELARAKVEVMQSQKHSEELYEKAINAFKSYGGKVFNNSDDEGEDDD